MYDLTEQSQISGEIPESGNIGISLSDVLHIIWLRKILLITVTVFISILGMLYVSQLVPRYTATAQLLIGIDQAKVIDIEQVLETGSLDNDAKIMIEMEVLKSRELARKVIVPLHLEQYEEFNPELGKPGFFAQLSFKKLLPETWQEKTVEIDNRTAEEKDAARLRGLIDIFLSKLKVSQVKRSSVINVTFEANDPKLAAKIANEVADKYIVDQLQAKFDATKKATDWLNDQLGELKEKVELSERAVEQYRKTHELLEVSSTVALSQQQLAEVNTQLMMTRAQRAEAEAKYQQVEAIARSGRNIDTVAEVLNSLLITSLRQKESDVQRQYSEMQVEFGPRHPKMMQMQAELEDIEAKVRSEIGKIAIGLRNSMELARAREASLESSLRQMESKTTGNNQAQVELHTLEREANANKALFETFLGRFKETTLSQGIAQASARVISFAEIPLGPSYPQKNKLYATSVIGALFVAFFLVFAIEMLNPGVRTPEKAQELFNMAVLGIVPKVMDIKVAPHEYLLAQPQSSFVEAVNSLRISLNLFNPDTQGKSLLVTSSVPGEGKSTLSILLARRSASAGQRVVLIDADLRRPTIGKKFKLNENPFESADIVKRRDEPLSDGLVDDTESALGLTDLLMFHDLSLNEVLVDDPETGVKILPRGKSAFVNPVDLFASKRMKSIIDDLREQFDLVILDTAPIMAVPDTRILVGLVDKTILVVDWNATPRKLVQNALQILSQDGHGNVAGIVFQKVNLQQYGRHEHSDYGHYFQYYTS